MNEILPFVGLMATVASGTALLTAPGYVTHAGAAEAAAYTYNTSTDAIFQVSNRGIFIDARVNGKPLRFLVDTGASLTILSKTDADALGVRGTKPVTITGIGGNVRAKAAHVHLTIGGRRIGPLKVAVIDATPHSLLGLDALHELGTPKLSFR